MPKIILYQFGKDIGVESGFPFCVKVHRILSYKKLPYSVKNMGLPKAIREVSPETGKLPVIRYDGELIQDSSRIFNFLKEKHPESFAVY